MAIISRLTGEDVTTRYEAVDRGEPDSVFTEFRSNDRVVNRAVRVLVLNAPLARPELMDVLSAAMTRMAYIYHPAAERVLDILEVKGTLALVLEPRRGSTLTQRIEKIGAFPVAYAVDVACSVAEALQAGHRAGVLHGNLNARSIYLSPEGIVKVSGLGLAGALAAVPPGLRPADVGPVISPTPGGDVKAFGTIFAQLLTGRVKDAGVDVAGWKENYPSIPTALRNMVQCLLRNAPAYSTMDEVVQDLHDIRDAIRLGRPMPVIPLPGEHPSSNGGRNGAARGRLPLSDNLPDSAVESHSGRSGAQARQDSVVVPPMMAGAASRTAATAAKGAAGARANGIRRRGSDDAESAPAARPRRERPRPSLGMRMLRAFLTLLFLLLLLPGAFFGAFAYLNWLASTPEVTIPSLHGLTVDEAREKTKRLNLKLEEDPSRTFNNSFPPGAILRQVPAPGLHTKAPRVVRVFLSSGSAMVKVPSVINKTVADAIKLMDQAGVRHQKKGISSSPTIPNGSIVTQFPPAGTTVPRGAMLFYRVSAGPSENDLEQISPDLPKDRTVEISIPPDPPKPQSSKPSHKGASAPPPPPDKPSVHDVSIRETDTSGEERTLWRGTGHAGETLEEDVTVDPYEQLKIYLDGHPIQSRLELSASDHPTADSTLQDEQAQATNASPPSDHSAPTDEVLNTSAAPHT